MIKTTFDEAFDLKAAIRPGARVGIVGCANCASVYRTGDTDRVEQVRTLLAGHCDVVLATSVDSPCDQRVLRYLAKSLPRFDDVEVFVVLACEAGTRSLGAIVAAAVVSPVRTEQFSILAKDGTSRRACLFCTDCRFTARSRPCPMAACPLRRADGPCQTRTSDRCVIDGDTQCSWHGAAGAPLPSSSSLSLHAPSSSSFPSPTLVLPTPATLADLSLLTSRLASWKVGLAFLAPVASSLDPLAAVAIMRSSSSASALPLLGFCPDYATRTTDALSADLRTAAALGVHHLFLREPDWTAPTAVEGLSTLAVIAAARAVVDGSFVIAVQNCFLAAGDGCLLQAQFDAGATVVLSASPQAPSGCLRLTADSTVDDAVLDLTALAREAVVEVGDRRFA